MNYRILTADRRIKYAGTGHDSWFDLDTARKLVDYSKGEGIYYFHPSSAEPLWEIL